MSDKHKEVASEREFVNPKYAEKETANKEILWAGWSAAVEVLLRPKNIKKPPFGKDIHDLFQKVFGEMIELSAELDLIEIDYVAARLEAGDAIAYLSAFVSACDEKLREVKNGR